MHEYALADAVLRAVLQVAEAERFAHIVRVDVRVGELQRIDPAVFEQALEVVRPPGEARLEGMTLHVAVEPARLACRACGTTFPLDEASGRRDADADEAIHLLPELVHAFLRCPGCGSPDFEVQGGRGVGIASIEGEPGDA